MSLALFRERIEAGEVDETVRQHLKGCDECRALYDELALMKRALGDDGAAEEKERLLGALPKQAAAAPSRPRWPLAVAAMLLAVVALLLLNRKPTDDVQMRGTGTDETGPGFSLRVYGKDAPGQPVRLIADFPGSKEATIGPRSELQYFVRPGAKTLLVETRGGGGKTVTVRNEPATEDLVPIGKAFTVGGFGPGNIEVCAAVVAPGQQTLEDAVRAGSTKHCSTLVVTP